MELVVEFKALADKTRLRILGILLNRGLCVCEIMDILGMTQSRISRHLGILKQAGFVEEERRGKWVIYRIADKHSVVLTYVQKQLKGDPSYTIDLARIKKTLRKKLCPIDY
ncbi:MAG TPA: metalloregulator ArsR/SmtB family transcription factor [Candidatus Brocadiales bacterium]|nr:metalloregulator ArsR/SmtB family transcription factor [Candidatus Brocadiales bacterium]